MEILGIVGGVASGKSLATHYFEQRGAAVLDGDRAGHEVLRQPDVVAAATERWGARILDADEQISRAHVAQIVFADSQESAEELAFLEKLTHPRIGLLLQEQAAKFAEAGATQVAVLDAPVLFKAGWDTFCDRIVFVNAPFSLRESRAQERGWSTREWSRREAAQASIEKKRAHSDHVLDNSGTPEELGEQIFAFWDSHWG